MKVVIPGGTGHIGAFLRQWYSARGDEVHVLGRTPGPDTVAWDGKTLGDWAKLVDGADVVINLAGRTVNCRYTEENFAQMMSSRVDSTRVVGQAIAAAARPPRVWLQMSTATIYAHRLDAANDEATGIIGGHEPDVPAYWARSIEVAKAWEKTLDEAPTPNTRRVALRTAMVMGAEPGAVFDVLARLARKRLGGAIAGGTQYMSWIHERDFARALDWIVAHDGLVGPINLATPGPLPQRAFMAGLRDSLGIGVGLPATRWMAKLGAFVLRTDPELVLKSRRVVPGRLVADGFTFEFPTWDVAAVDLAARWRAGAGSS